MCHRRVALTLIYAGELGLAETHCVAAFERWQSEKALALLEARITYMKGNCAVATATIASLLTARLPVDVHAMAVAWLVEFDDLDRAQSVLIANDMLGGPATPVVVAARAALHPRDRQNPASREQLPGMRQPPSRGQGHQPCCCPVAIPCGPSRPQLVPRRPRDRAQQTGSPSTMDTSAGHGRSSRLWTKCPHRPEGPGRHELTYVTPKPCGGRRAGSVLSRHRDLSAFP